MLWHNPGIRKHGRNLHVNLEFGMMAFYDGAVGKDPRWIQPGWRQRPAFYNGFPSKPPHDTLIKSFSVPLGPWNSKWWRLWLHGVIWPYHVSNETGTYSFETGNVTKTRTLTYGRPWLPWLGYCKRVVTRDEKGVTVTDSGSVEKTTRYSW